MTTDTATANTDINFWLKELDSLPLECDGLARAASHLLHREQVEHTVHWGRTTIDDVGTIEPHLWIELADGRILDLRARMWLGSADSVPHGLFAPEAHQHYQPQAVIDVAGEHPIVFWALTNRTVESYPTGLAEALEKSSPAALARPRPR